MPKKNGEEFSAPTKKEEAGQQPHLQENTADTPLRDWKKTGFPNQVMLMRKTPFRSFHSPVTSLVQNGDCCSPFHAGQRGVLSSLCKRTWVRTCQLTACLQLQHLWIYLVFTLMPPCPSCSQLMNKQGQVQRKKKHFCLSLGFTTGFLRAALLSKDLSTSPPFPPSSRDI
jgi:hypothetical protein